MSSKELIDYFETHFPNYKGFKKETLVTFYPKKTNINIKSLNVDNRNQTIQITIENRTAIVEGITITMEEAKEIGFINFDVLEKYCK